MCSNHVSVSQHFWDTATFAVHVTACNLAESVIFYKLLGLEVTYAFWVMFTHIAGIVICLIL